jgi:hypothetical protein
MTLDLTKIGLDTRYPIDKVVQQGTITLANDGNTTAHITSYQTAKITETTATNTYGRAGLVRAKWSIDGGTNWQSLDSELTYAFTVTSVPGDPGHPISTTLSGLDAAVSIGCSDSTLTFRTANGGHGNVTGIITPSYTPTSRTFIIKYALYERD